MKRARPFNIYPRPALPPSRGREIYGGPLPWRIKEILCGASLVFLFFLLSSCATVIYSSPTQGTSAELQAALARSLEDNLKDLSFNPTGKTIDLQVRAWGGYQNSRGLERYVRSLFQEWIVDKGGKVGPGDFRMEVFLPVMGTTVTRRDLSYQNIPLYYSERFRLTTQLVVVVRDREGRLAELKQLGQAGDLTDVFLMRIFGPFGPPF